MATTRIFKDGSQLSLPVPADTVSGDPLVLGSLPCVALTDRAVAGDNGGGGNVDGEATVQLFPSGVFDLEVIANDGVAVAVGVGDPVYLQADGTIDADSAGDLFGYALEAIASGATATINVKLAAV